MGIVENEDYVMAKSIQINAERGIPIADCVRAQRTVIATYSQCAQIGTRPRFAAG